MSMNAIWQALGLVLFLLVVAIDWQGPFRRKRKS